MLRKVFEFGSVLEHVCQVWVPKVVDLEVISGVFRLGPPGVSWGSLWGRLGGRSGGVLEVILGSLETALDQIRRYEPVQNFEPVEVAS
jgi:hypothetical protein